MNSEFAREMAEKQRDLVRNILDDVAAEVDRAIEKHPSMMSTHHGYAVIQEEVDELWDLIKRDRGRFERAREEALQIAATAVRYILDLLPRHDDDDIPF